MRVSLISNIIKNTNLHDPEDFLGIYLLFNMDFFSLVSKTRNHVDEKTKDFLENFRSVNKNTKGIIDRNIKKVNSVEELRKYTVDIVEVYKNIINVFSSSDELTVHLESFIRPLQDSYKLYSFLIKDNKYQHIHDVVVLDNPNNVHADSNVAHYFSNGDYLENNYIGVSKLCCGYCHKYLDNNNFLHRGTHGVCDDEWNMPWSKKGEKAPHDQYFKDSINEIYELDQSNPPKQNRRLSIDNLEKEININKEQTLWQFKVNNELIQGKVPKGIKGYIFYEGKTVPCEYKYIDHDYEEVQIGGENGKILSYCTSGYWGLD